MPRLMYDAVTARNILKADKRPQMVAGYSDTIKIPQWTDSDWNLFPNSVKVQIVKKASSNWGHVLDVEPGDATPAEAPGWVKKRRASGLATPCIYVQKSSWATVQNEFNKQSVAQPLYWIAHYNDIKELPSLNGITAIAKQYHGNDPNGYDISYVADFWPGVDGVEEDMPFSPEDFKNFMWGNVFDGPAVGGRNYAAYIKDMDAKLSGLTSAITSLTKLVVANEANDVTPESLVNALEGFIQANMIPAVLSAVDHALENKELNVDSSELSDSIITNLKELTFKAV